MNDLATPRIDGRRRALTLAATLVLVAPLQPGNAQGVRWLGGEGEWSNAAHWSSGVAPNGPTVDVLIDGDDALPSWVRLVGAVEVRSLDLSLFDQLTVGGELLVWDSVRNRGRLDVSGGAVFLFGALDNAGAAVVLRNGMLSAEGITGGTIDLDNGRLFNGWPYTGTGAAARGVSIHGAGVSQLSGSFRDSTLSGSLRVDIAELASLAFDGELRGDLTVAGTDMVLLDRTVVAAGARLRLQDGLYQDPWTGETHTRNAGLGGGVLRLDPGAELLANAARVGGVIENRGTMSLTKGALASSSIDNRQGRIVLDGGSVLTGAIDNEQGNIALAGGAGIESRAGVVGGLLTGADGATLSGRLLGTRLEGEFRAVAMPNQDPFDPSRFTFQGTVAGTLRAETDISLAGGVVVERGGRMHLWGATISSEAPRADIVVADGGEIHFGYTSSVGLWRGVDWECNDIGCSPFTVEYMTPMTLTNRGAVVLGDEGDFSGNAAFTSHGVFDNRGGTIRMAGPSGIINAGLFVGAADLSGGFFWQYRHDYSAAPAQGGQVALRLHVGLDEGGVTADHLSADQVELIDGALQIVLRPESSATEGLLAGSAFDFVIGSGGIQVGPGLSFMVLVTDADWASLAGVPVSPYISPWLGDSDTLWLVETTMFSFSLFDDATVLRGTLLTDVPAVPEPERWALLVVGLLTLLSRLRGSIGGRGL